MSTIYLKFPDTQTALESLVSAGYELTEYNDHCNGDGWGTVFSIPDEAGHFANLYDCRVLHESLVQYEVPPPSTPYNVRAGDA